MATVPESSLKWSAQFHVAPAERSHLLSGDKITLPQSALEGLLSASSNLAAEKARRDIPTYDPFNSATFSTYRQAESQYEDQKQQLPYPLTFRLVNPQNGRAVYAGIREFSAEVGEAELSAFLRETLGLKDVSSLDSNAMKIDDELANGQPEGAKITVHAKQLPKGTFVKLRPLEAGYDTEDWKALLERQLRQNYTTLTNGEVLVVQGGKGMNGKKEEFRFLVDGFKPEGDGICVVDTDLEVDIEALNEEQARETLRRIIAKTANAPGSEQSSSSVGDLGLFQSYDGQVLPGEYVDYRLSSWNRAEPLEIEIDGDTEDDHVELLISPYSPTQRSKPRIDEHVFADFESRPTKRLRLEPSNVELEHAEALLIAVHAYTPIESTSNGHSATKNGAAKARHFKIRAHHPDPVKSLGHESEDVDTPPNPGDVRCKNCRKWFPKQSLVLHDTFCLRNNVLCPHGCGTVFQKRSPEYSSHWHCPHDTAYGNGEQSKLRHDELFHPSEVLRCSECATKETFCSIPALAQHRTTTCPAKLILCRFCHLTVPQEGDPDGPNAEALLSGMTPHELADGARTTECHMCSKIVRLRDMDAHIGNHNLDRLSRPPPLLCRNVYCGRTLDVCSKSGDTRAGTRMGQGPGNDIGVCSSCFGPLYVGMYDPENKALKRRVERRYLQQLLTGCGKAWCRNEFCKTGRTHLDLPANLNTKDSLPMIKPFLDSLLLTHSTPLHFCVDEKSQKRKNVADMMAAESGGPANIGTYDLNWCVGAMEAEDGDLDAARQWLKNWAPTKQEGIRK